MVYKHLIPRTSLLVNTMMDNLPAGDNNSATQRPCMRHRRLLSKDCIVVRLDQCLPAKKRSKTREKKVFGSVGAPLSGQMNGSPINSPSRKVPESTVKFYRPIRLTIKESISDQGSRDKTKSLVERRLLCFTERMSASALTCWIP